jgi:sporulation protein YlmC with PRC-barrel domain
MFTMTTPSLSALSKLSETGQTVATADEDVRGRKVVDRDGEDVGRVDDLLIDDAERKVRFLHVAHGGFLGIGDTKSYIPVDAITRITEDAVHIDQAREHIAGAPKYDPEVVAEPDYYGGIYGYYGYAPFWGPGYLYPAFPYYR